MLKINVNVWFYWMMYCDGDVGWIVVVEVGSSRQQQQYKFTCR